MKPPTTDDDALSDAELLAFLLRNDHGLADDLLARFGSLREVLQTDPARLVAEPGVGTATATTIRAIPELARRYFASSLKPGQSIRSPADTRTYLQSRLGHLGHEVFCCLFLDNRHRVLRFDEMFRGTIDGTSVYPREVVKEALTINAAAVILAHNHPSGVAEPSQADERITRRLKSALELVDIRLLDHLIIGDGRATSMASRGLL
jgi:DNA repair protein RadC